jgi:hypothetical protein
MGKEYTLWDGGGDRLIIGEIERLYDGIFCGSGIGFIIEIISSKILGELKYLCLFIDSVYFLYIIIDNFAVRLDCDDIYE